jgi:hypothetical protein
LKRPRPMIYAKGHEAMSNRERILVVILTGSLCLHVLQTVAWWGGWPQPAPIAAGPSSADEQPVWHTKQMALADTGYVAFVGPWVYEQDADRRPTRYSVSVERPTPTGSHSLYHVDLKTEDLPAGISEQEVADIVAYDPKTRVVSFTVGDRVYGCRLPRP